MLFNLTSYSPLMVESPQRTDKMTGDTGKNDVELQHNTILEVYLHISLLNIEA